MAVGSKIGMKVLSLAIGIPVGMAVKSAVEKTWATARPDTPARRTTDNDVNWVDALAWGTLSAAGIVIADLVTRRGAEAAFSALTGHPVPAPGPGKGAKHLQKAAEKSAATNE